MSSFCLEPGGGSSSSVTVSVKVWVLDSVPSEARDDNFEDMLIRSPVLVRVGLIHIRPWLGIVFYQVRLYVIRLRSFAERWLVFATSAAVNVRSSPSNSPIFRLTKIRAAPASSPASRLFQYLSHLVVLVSDASKKSAIGAVFAHALQPSHSLGLATNTGAHIVNNNNRF